MATILVTTSTFPRWADDIGSARFVFDLSLQMAQHHQVIVLAPHAPGAAYHETLNGLDVWRFPYFRPHRLQALCNGGGILPAIGPGLQPERWENRNNFVAHGIMETASGIPGTPKEMTLYSMEGYYRGENCQMRRYTWRLDGCVSAHARLSGGELITKPLIFDGKSLQINFATSAAGSVRIELQQAHRQPVEHFTLADSEEIYGDAIERQVSWNSRTDVSHLAGQPVRIRFILSDAEIFAFRFV